MNFKLYDVLAHLIPGFLIIAFVSYWTETPFDNNNLLPATAIAFLIGYFINTLSSWLEGVYYWTWNGNPGASLLKGRKCWKVYFNVSDKEKAISLLSSDLEKKDDYKTMFAIAKRIAESNDTMQRLRTFNTNFAFSRVLLTTILILSPFIIILHHQNWLIVISVVILLVISWLRAKQRAYYYAREVINIYLTVKR